MYGPNPGACCRPRVKLLPAVGLLYASACGGPYGTEDFVVRTGPGLLLVLLFAAAWLWGGPNCPGHGGAVWGAADRGWILPLGA